MKKLLLLTLSFSLLLTSCKKPKKVTIPTPSPPSIESNSTTTILIPTKDAWSHLDSKQKEVKRYLEHYLNALKGFDSDTVVHMTYPKLFQVINQELFRQYINSMINSSDILVESFESNITNIEPIESFQNGQFSRLSYSTNTKIVLLNPNIYNNDTNLNFLYDAFIHKYGVENITFVKSERSIRIQEQKDMLAIKEGENEWKFLSANEEYRKFYPSILPIELLGQL